MIQRDQRGFTFLELLTVITMIGILATIGSVSYEAARKYALDVKRVSDMNALQTALELYYDSHLSYPFDGARGGAGSLLGSKEGGSFSDAGFNVTSEGAIYMLRVPKNPEPGGIPYIFRSVNVDGTDCDKPQCANYQIIFSTEGSVAGLDAGVHVLTQGGVRREAEAPVGTLPEVHGGFAEIALQGLDRAVFTFKETAIDVLDNPTIEIGTETVVAPVATAGLIGALASAAPLVQLPRYLLFFFSQPFFYLTRRRRRAYGVVYNALSKLPVDLAIVRVRDTKSGAVLRSAVTDREGRYNFILRRGEYRLEVAKPGFQFPTQTLGGEAQDGDYLDLYYGENIRIASESAALARSIPIDPLSEDQSNKILLRQAFNSRLRSAVAFSGPVMAMVSFAVVPSIRMGLLVILHLVLFFAFRRLSRPEETKDHGVVYSEDEIGRASCRERV